MPSGASGMLGRLSYHHSDRHLDRFAGGQGSAMRLFLLPFAYQSHVWLFDDFLGDTVNLDLYTTGESGSGTAFAIPSNNSVSGVIQAVTGGSNGNAETIRSEAQLLGSNNCWMEASIRLPSV